MKTPTALALVVLRRGWCSTLAFQEKINCGDKTVFFQKTGGSPTAPAKILTASIL